MGRTPNPRAEPAARRHPFIWVVWLTALAAVAIFGYAAWLLLQDGGTAKFFGWSDGPRGSTWSVATVDSTGPAAGQLQPGDRLISLNGDSNVTRAGTRAHRREVSIGESYRLRIARGGEEAEYTLVVARGENRLARRLSYFFVSLVWSYDTYPYMQSIVA